jgi:hypothetical protein
MDDEPIEFTKAMETVDTIPGPDRQRRRWHRSGRVDERFGRASAV